MTGSFDTVPAALWLAAVVFALYFVKSALEAWERTRAEVKKAESLACALYAEMQAHQEQLKEFLSTPDSLPVFTGHPIFDRYIDQIDVLPCGTVGAIAAFYNATDRLKLLARNYRRQALREQADARNVKQPETLRVAAQLAASLGQEALHSFEIHAPRRLRQSMLLSATAAKEDYKQLKRLAHEGQLA